jgi:pimeloyl-ACP methyl ester carboxylesterase
MADLALSDDISLHYEEWGAADSPAVLLLHGFTSDLRAWAPVVEPLAEEYRVVALDLRGHGQSSAPADPAAYTMETYAGDVHALLDALEIGLCAVVGSSFGGMIALQVATTWPERLAGLVVSDASAAYEDSRYDEAYYARERAIAESCEIVAAYGTGMLGKRLAAPLHDEFLRAGMVRRYANLRPEAYLGAARVRRERPNLLPLLQGRLSMPVLICAGEHDPVRSASEVIAQELPAARFVLFRDAGHTVPYHRPGAFVDELLSFLHDIEDGKEIAGRREV